MRIAFISTILHYPWGGADALWTQAAEAAIARGDSIFISVSPAVASHARVVALQTGGATIHVRPPDLASPSLTFRLLRKLGFPPAADTALIAALEKFRPDLVVFSFGGTYDLLLHRALTAWLLEARTRFRLVANWQTEHPQLGSDDLAFLRNAFAAADRANFVSTHNLEVTRRHLLAPLPNARVLHNPLRWRPADSPPWPSATGTRLATVSRLDHNKGIHLLLHALAAMAAELPDWHLDIFGTGPQESYLRDTVSHLGLAHRVAFRGHVSSLRDIWAENHLFISPAIDEGVPMTIPEAMLCARPVLATCVGGAEDWIRHGETGFLCAAPTVPLLAAALLDATQARNRWQSMGTAAANAARQHYRASDHLALIA